MAQSKGSKGNSGKGFGSMDEQRQRVRSPGREAVLQHNPILRIVVLHLWIKINKGKYQARVAKHHKPEHPLKGNADQQEETNRILLH
jgi:hypothetical protein